MGSPRVQLQLVPVGKWAAAATAKGLDWLTEAESARLHGMRSQARRDSFLAGHWLARKTAARWLGVQAARITLGNFADGRPSVRLDDAPVPLSLSLSHSGEWLALALGEVAVGIDIELPRRSRDIDALAGFAFAPEDRQRLRECDPAEREHTFLELWALHEARGKRSGEGMQPRRSREYRMHPFEPASAQAMSWRFHGGALALAMTPGVRVESKGAHLGEAFAWRYS